MNINLSFTSWLFLWIILSVGYWASVGAGHVIFMTAPKLGYAPLSLYWWLSIWINLSIAYWISIGAGYAIVVGVRLIHH